MEGVLGLGRGMAGARPAGRLLSIPFRLSRNESGDRHRRAAPAMSWLAGHRGIGAGVILSECASVFYSDSK